MNPVSLAKNNRLTGRFQWLLENNFREKKAVSQYAKDLFVTPNHLNRVLKEFTGFSARQLIQQRIIMEAKKKACERGSTMKAIAYDLGFTDIAHFSKYFKNTSGINFSSFKKKSINHTFLAR
jgi:AraC-like DNA-binding protein